MGEWTTAPWRGEPGRTRRHLLDHIYGADVLICRIEPTRNIAEAIANGRLIVAAPDLYDALKALVDALTGRVHSTPALTALREARRALAQADGAEPRDA